MRIPGPRLGRPRWLRLPRRTARLHLTVLYGSAFMGCGACGATVLAVIQLLYGRMTLQQASHRTAYPRTTNSAHIAPVASQPTNVTIHLGSLGEFGFNFGREQLLVAAAIGLAVFVVAVVVLGWILAGRVLRPLRTITTAARRISASSLHERLALHGAEDELKELADTLDNLFARLEASFDAQRRFAANASHEMRTPLTRERTLLQVTLADPASTTSTWQAVGRQLLASNAEQEHLIEALLTLASSEVGTGERETADLAAVTGAAVAAARPAISRFGLQVHAELQPAVLDGDPFLVQQLVGNLIDNAVRHNIPGGDIHITTKTSRAGTVLSVANSGEVIPAAEIDRLFQPFQRLGQRPARRDSHGLGLSIVKAIATAHAAAITAQPRLDGGLAIDVTFPPATSAQTSQPDAGRVARV